MASHFFFFFFIFFSIRTQTQSKTPYNYSKTKEVRNAFRRLMARQPDRWDYVAAQIPSPLTEEMERAEREKEAQLEKDRKKREKKQNKKQKQKAGKGDDNESSDDEDDDGKKAPPTVHSLKQQQLQKPLAPKVQQGSAELERERRARAAEQRMAQLGITPSGPLCTSCQRPLQGLVPFERLEFKYCSTKCVADHRRVLGR